MSNRLYSLREEKRFLCVCHWGYNRSMALARLLHREGHVAIPCGIESAGTGLDALSEWATHIFVMDRTIEIPERYGDKVVSFHVGPDVWGSPTHPRLVRILSEMLRHRLAKILQRGDSPQESRECP